MSEFSDRVYAVVKQVPAGKVTTYGQVARLMGRPQSARYVGFALRRNPEPWSDGGGIPCHRVLFQDGSLCPGFAFGGPEVQRELLQAEGVTFVDDNHVDLDSCLWDGRRAHTGIAEYEGTPTHEEDSEEKTEPPSWIDWHAELEEDES